MYKLSYQPSESEIFRLFSTLFQVYCWSLLRGRRGTQSLSLEGSLEETVCSLRGGWGLQGSCYTCEEEGCLFFTKDYALYFAKHTCGVYAYWSDADDLCPASKTLLTALNQPQLVKCAASAMLDLICCLGSSRHLVECHVLPCV